MASSSPVHFTNSYQPSSHQDTSKTGLVSSVGSTRSYGTVKDSHSFLGAGLVKNYFIHEVGEGDTLQGLALKYNVTVHQIQKANNIWNTNSLHIRPTIKIPEQSSRNSSRSQSPSPTMSRKTDCKTRLSVEHLHVPSAFGENGEVKGQSSSSYNGITVEGGDEVRSKVSSRRRYESDSAVGSDGVKSIAGILNSADEQLKLSKEFAEKLAQRSAQRALPEGAYNRTADMKDHTRREHHSPSPSYSSSMESSSKSRKAKVAQSSVKESATREERVDQIFEL